MGRDRCEAAAQGVSFRACAQHKPRRLMAATRLATFRGQQAPRAAPEASGTAQPLGRHHAATGASVGMHVAVYREAWKNFAPQ